MNEVTQILSASEQGDTRAADQPFPLVDDKVVRLDVQKLVHEAPGQTLLATALVHEEFLNLVEVKAQQWNSRGHVFAAAAESMGRILVDRARKTISRWPSTNSERTCHQTCKMSSSAAWRRIRPSAFRMRGAST
jgi:hypothetical protein